MEERLVIATFQHAVRNRQPATGLIHHTDRGGQYAGKEYRKLLTRAQMSQSMSCAGDCYDNAVMESCFGTLKTEHEMKTYPSIQQASTEITDYINYYNALRRHSAIDYQSPTSFEATSRH
jgi:transposase InsO family protein